MKKFLIISTSGILIGTIFAIYMFSNINREAAKTFEKADEVTAFQVGVFSVYDNAKKVSDTYTDSYIYQDGDKYRVFLAIYQDQEIIEYMTDYYKGKNIEFYLKKMNVNDVFLDELNKYEDLLKQTSDKDTYISANQNILGAFAKSL